MKNEKIKIAIISILTLIGTYCITTANVQLPMVENDGSIYIKFITLMVLFGFFSFWASLGDLVCKYHKEKQYSSQKVRRVI